MVLYTPIYPYILPYTSIYRYIGAIYPLYPLYGVYGGMGGTTPGYTPQGGRGGGTPTHPSGVRVYITRGSAEVLNHPTHSFPAH